MAFAKVSDLRRVCSSLSSVVTYDLAQEDLSGNSIGNNKYPDKASFVIFIFLSGEICLPWSESSSCSRGNKRRRRGGTCGPADYIQAALMLNYNKRNVG